MLFGRGLASLPDPRRRTRPARWPRRTTAFFVNTSPDEELQFPDTVKFRLCRCRVGMAMARWHGSAELVVRVRST